jgi:hypothetical protein
LLPADATKEEEAEEEGVEVARKKLDTIASTLLAMEATSRAGENSCSKMVFSKGFLGSQLSMSLSDDGDDDADGDMR